MDEETLTVWLDTALLMLGGFVLMSVLMMTVMNPPTKSSARATTSRRPAMSSSRHSGPTRSTPTSTSGQAPGDVPVGYSNKSGKIFNLLRDDLGSQDITDYNYEVAYTRGTPGGEYVVNLHMYRGGGVSYPVRQDRRQREARSDRRGQTAGRDHSAAAQGEPGAHRAPLPPRRERRPRRRQRQQPVQTPRAAAK